MAFVGHSTEKYQLIWNTERGGCHFAFPDRKKGGGFAACLSIVVIGQNVARQWNYYSMERDYTGMRGYGICPE